MVRKEPPKIEPIDMSLGFSFELCLPVKEKLPKDFEVCGPHILVKACTPLKQFAPSVCDPVWNELRCIPKVTNAVFVPICMPKVT